MQNNLDFVAEIINEAASNLLACVQDLTYVKLKLAIVSLLIGKYSVVFTVRTSVDRLLGG